jgi:hypothetical protein
MVRLWLSVVLAFGCELPQASRVALRGELEVALATGPVRLGPIESLDRGQRYFLALTTIDPSFEARAELEVAGITLGPRVEPRLWWMELAPNADLSLAATVVEAAGVVPPERKIDRSIGDGGLVFVLSHEPIPNATRGLLEGWYEARLSRAAIEELATRPAVRFIASAEDTSTSRPLADAVRARIGVEEVQASASSTRSRPTATRAAASWPACSTSASSTRTPTSAIDSPSPSRASRVIRPARRE